MFKRVAAARAARSFLRLPLVPEVQLFVGPEEIARANTDDVYWVDYCDIQSGLWNIRSS